LEKELLEEGIYLSLKNPQALHAPFSKELAAKRTEDCPFSKELAGEA